MRRIISSLMVISSVLGVRAGAEPVLEGQVRLSSGAPAVGVQVRLFDLADLRQSVGAITDEAGYFALPLRALPGLPLPSGFALGPNYPNPFNPSTIIPYQLPALTSVRLEVFNVLGQRIATLVDGERSGGLHTVEWDGTDAAGQAVGAGVYIYRLSSGDQAVSRRMVLVDGQAGIASAASSGSWPAADGGGYGGGWGLWVDGFGGGAGSLRGCGFSGGGWDGAGGFSGRRAGAHAAGEGGDDGDFRGCGQQRSGRFLRCAAGGRVQRGSLLNHAQQRRYIAGRCQRRRSG